MQIILSLLVALVVIIQPAHSLSHKNLENKVENYLNSITTFKANFVQYVADEVSTGQLQIKKPGAIRLDYSGAQNFLLILRRGRLTYYNFDLAEYANVAYGGKFLDVLANDGFSFSNFEGYELALDGDIITAQIMIAGNEDPGQTIQLTMIFAVEPTDDIVLDAIKINDFMNPITIIKLTDTTNNTPIDDKVFRFRNPNFLK